MHSLRARFAENLKPKRGYTSQNERESRAQKKLQERHMSRVAGFGRNRNIGDLKENIDIELAQNKVVKDLQRLKLERWKEERKKQKLANAQKKPFVCGVVTHNVGSPYWNNRSSRTALKVQKVLMCPRSTITTASSSRKQGARTRARGTGKQESEQKIEAMITIPANFKFKAPVGIKPLTIPAQPLKPSNTASSKQQPGGMIPQRVTRSMMAKAAQPTFNLHSLQNALSKTSVMTESAANLADAVEPTTMVMESVPLNQENSVSNAEENDTEMKGAVPVTPVSKTPKNDAECLPVHYSPFVTMERGSTRKSKGSTRKSKGSARKSLYPLQQNCLFTPVKESASNAENKDDETQKERSGVVYFRNVLQSEVERLELTSEKWLALRNSTQDLPEEICDSIDVAVGKARLLIKQKLNQFGTLINQCEAGSVPGMPGVTVKCSDLEGFWDMVYMQVEDVDTMFKVLEEAKSRNWQKENVPSAQIPAKRGRRRSIKKGKKEVAKSSLRAMIAAARKKNQDAVSELPSDVPEVNKRPRRFSSPIIVNRSSARKSVLQHVLATEAYKQGVTEDPKCSMLDLAGIGNNFSTPILIRDDMVSDLEEHGIMSNKSNISAIVPTPKSRQSYQRRLSKKVRFTGAENNHEEKPVQPMTPYTTGRGLRRRSSSIINSGERQSMQKSSPSSPDIDLLSPVERPQRVRRRSTRLIDK